MSPMPAPKLAWSVRANSRIASSWMVMVMSGALSSLASLMTKSPPIVQWPTMSSASRGAAPLPVCHPRL